MMTFGRRCHLTFSGRKKKNAQELNISLISLVLESTEFLQSSRILEKQLEVIITVYIS